MRTLLQHSRRACSIDSPARMMDTPQILPSNLTPLYVLPTGVVTVCCCTGKWFRPSSTSRRMIRLEWKMKSERFVCLSRMMLWRRSVCQFFSELDSVRFRKDASNIREKGD